MFFAVIIPKNVERIARIELVSMHGLEDRLHALCLPAL
jgi:hypothetical protein